MPNTDHDAKLPFRLQYSVSLQDTHALAEWIDRACSYLEKQLLLTPARISVGTTGGRPAPVGNRLEFLKRIARRDHPYFVLSDVVRSNGALGDVLVTGIAEQDGASLGIFVELPKVRWDAYERIFVSVGDLLGAYTGVLIPRYLETAMAAHERLAVSNDFRN